MSKGKRVAAGLVGSLLVLSIGFNVKQSQDLKSTKEELAQTQTQLTELEQASTQVFNNLMGCASVIQMAAPQCPIIKQIIESMSK
jgi:hypothetical protein